MTYISVCDKAQCISNAFGTAVREGYEVEGMQPITKRATVRVCQCGDDATMTVNLDK